MSDSQALLEVWLSSRGRYRHRCGHLQNWGGGLPPDEVVELARLAQDAKDALLAYVEEIKRRADEA